MSRIDISEKEFQAEDDMRTLMQAEEIIGDKKRLAAAKKKAEEKAELAKKVAGKKAEKSA